LTLPLLSSALIAMILVTGESKRDALRRLLARDDIPAARVRSNRVVVIADAAAAG
jgi:6-phosphogluconolactonase/glucosamine-6-phosphate isomerase/deaminase